MPGRDLSKLKDDSEKYTYSDLKKRKITIVLLYYK